MSITDEIKRLENKYNLNPTFDILKELREIMVIAQDANKVSEGFFGLLTKLYPDNAHYIFELLQNAQDANKDSHKPAVVRFILTDNQLEFEHNGKKLFDLKDVESITGLGVSTKIDDKTNIGKFGIGFKSVFAITKIPEIISGDFHFTIERLFIPNPLREKSEAKMPESRFIFPFNSDKKSATKAVEEIKKELCELGSETLLFLKKIKKIEYLLPDGKTLGYMEQTNEEDGITVIKADIPNEEEKVFHWLLYNKNIVVPDEDDKSVECLISIAFKLEKNDRKERKRDYKIISANPGKVCIFFPAEKETSKLNFHIHAPFASTVARDSVRNCEENDKLRDAIADLIAEFLIDIKERGLLSVDFLGVLPNTEDQLSAFYEPIRKKIVSAFKEKPLVPTKSGEYSPATKLFRGSADISEVIDDDDLSLLTGREIPLWAKNAPQKNQREDRFLDSLEIKKWGSEELKSIFNPKNDEERKKIEKWISNKPDAWLMKLYALLENEEINIDRTLRVVRTTNDNCVKAEEAYFPLNDKKDMPSNLNFVKLDVFNVGNAEKRKKDAHNFLEKIGVRIYDDNEKVRLHLIEIAHKYSAPSPNVSEKQHLSDITEFSEYEGDKNFLKGKYFVFDEKGKFCTVDTVCIPIIGKLIEQTGLGSEYNKTCINSVYEQLKEEMREKFTCLLQNLGAMYKLEVTVIKNYSPQESKDYTIRGIEKIISSLQSEPYRLQFAKLIWDAVRKCNIWGVENKHSRPDGRYNYRRECPSIIVDILTSKEWIPDKNGNLQMPQDISPDMLPEGFEINENSYLLKALKFGENIHKEESKKQKLEEAAKTLGVSLEIIESLKTVEESGIDINVILNELKKGNQCIIEETDDVFDPDIENNDEPFPNEPIKNLQHLQEKIKKRHDEAPKVTCEWLLRHIRISRGRDREHLRMRYHGYCQICEKKYQYWDVAEIFENLNKETEDLRKEIEQMNLSLCLNHAREYRQLRKKESLMKSFIENILKTNPEKDTVVKLGDKEVKFTNTHLAEIQVILEIEKELILTMLKKSNYDMENDLNPPKPH